MLPALDLQVDGAAAKIIKSSEMFGREHDTLWTNPVVGTAIRAGSEKKHWFERKLSKYLLWQKYFAWNKNITWAWTMFEFLLDIAITYIGRVAEWFRCHSPDKNAVNQREFDLHGERPLFIFYLVWWSGSSSTQNNITCAMASVPVENDP